MLDHVCLVTRGGVVLWKRQVAELKDAPVDKLIVKALIEERTGQTHTTIDRYTVRWHLDNKHSLIAVAVYHNVGRVVDVARLLSKLTNDFVAGVGEQGVKDLIAGRCLVTPVQTKQISARYDTVLRRLEADVRGAGAGASAAAATPSRSVADAGKHSDDTSGDAANATNGTGHGQEDLSPATSNGNGNGDDPAVTASSPSPPFPMRRREQKKPRSYAESNAAKKKKIKADSKAKDQGKSGKDKDKDNNTEDDASKSPAPAAPSSKRDLIRAKLEESGRVRPQGKKTPASPPPEPAERKGKVAREWDGALGKEPDARAAAKFDHTDGTGPDAEQQLQADLDRWMPDRNAKMDVDNWDVGDGDDDGDGDGFGDDDEAEESQASKAATAAKNKLFGLFSTLTGNRTLDRETLAPVMEKFKAHLVMKNVAEEIADKLCESVAASLNGKTTSSWQSIHAAVKEAMEAALVRIMTPNRNVDVLRDIQAAKEKQRPFTIVFVGVNGVGKSTSLSKTCFWLKQHGLRVLIAACDTFRSGAVEQLRRHANCLDVYLFDRGYGKDASAIAEEAVRFAAHNRFDVVLIDTAGRMQDNAPLMQSLAKLIDVNRPDEIFFVGEALVGNDGVDQLMKFNQCLADYSKSAEPRLIDGIILTKFDTIDDKVGAALSMVYASRQPIVFVGVGQHYPDLKKMNVQTVIKALLR